MIIVDTYEEKTLKEATRQSRGNSIMHLAKIDHYIPVPKRMDRFCHSTKNKEIFQNYIRELFVFIVQQNYDDVLLSGMQVNCQQIPAVSVCNQEVNTISSLLCFYALLKKLIRR